MKQLIVLCCGVLGMLWQAAQVRANDVLLVQTNLNTDFTVAGVGGMRGVGSGTITLAGVQGIVTRAYLYWHGPMNAIDPTANAAVFIDGQQIVGTNIGFSAPNCWPNLTLSQAYRADVTAIVAAKGNGAYQLTGFLKPNNVNINGASLIVFFSDNNPNNNRDVVLFHGNDSNFHNSYDADGWNVILPGISYTPGTNNNTRAFLQLHVADGQVFPDFDDDALRINGVVVAPSGVVFSGNSVPSANNGPKNNGSLWDIKLWEITSLLDPGPNTVSVATGYVEGGDCLSLVLAVVDLPMGTIAPPPACTLVCSSDILVNTTGNQCGATVNYPLPVASGNCGGPVVCAPPSGSVFPVGTTLVTCSTPVTNCTFKVIVSDKDVPVFSTPVDLVQGTDPGQCAATVNYTVMASDNCPGATFNCAPVSGSVFPVGSTTVNCTATDASGNVARTSFKVTVNDTQKPALTQPADISKPADPGKITAVVTFPLPAAQDNCPGVTVACLPASGTAFPLGPTTVTCTATDTSNNKTNVTFKVTVGDNEKPVIVCPADIVKNNDAGLCSAVVNYTVTATDNVAGVTVACVPASGSVFPVGATTVNCTATDTSGNTAACSFKVTVMDGQRPTIAQPPDISKPADPGKITAVVTFPLPAAQDNCPGVTVACLPASGTAFPLGPTTVTCTATDTSNNKTNVTFKVTVGDNEKPVIVCPADIVKNNDAGLCSAVVNYTVTATDNVAGVTVACVPASGSVFPVGATTVNCTATDTSGNTAACSFKVTVADGENPTIAQPADIVKNADPGKIAAMVTFPLPAAQDNCPGVTVACVPPSGSEFPIGATAVTCTATDAARNSRSTSFTVTVIAGPGELALAKTADKLSVIAGGPVTYTYVVTNRGATALTELVVTDDNGTPSYKGDDFVVTTNLTLAPFQSRTFTKTVILPLTLGADNTATETGLLITEILANGDIKATFIQDPKVNDNTYGINAVGWGGGGHKFGDLTGSDQATFSFTDSSGNVSLKFKVDYITASRVYPSGFGTLGVSGGDGGMLIGNASNVVAASTSLTENLNKAPFLSSLGTYTVNSPASTDPNSRFWEYRMIFTVVVKGSAFGSPGFGRVDILSQHNSPAKEGFRYFTPTPMEAMVTSIAVGIAKSGGATQTASAQTVVKVTAGQNALCPLKYSYWKKEAGREGWVPTGYLPSQSLGSVFTPLPSDAASSSLLKALEGKAGTKDADAMLKQGVAALLNAAHPGIMNQFAFTREQVITSINAALAGGDKDAMNELAKSFYEANKDCKPRPTDPSCSTCAVDYPYASSNPRTSIVFNESEVLRGFSTNVARSGDKLRVWYNDEHALVLGVRQVVVKSSKGTTTSTYPVTPLPSSPASSLNPAVGSMALTGDQAGTDLEGRPMFPALFITDITADLGSRAGDWQFGGTAIPPHAIFGSWKAAVRTVDTTRSPAVVTVIPDNDPAENDWNLAGGGPVPAGLKNEGYGTEVRWNLSDLGLTPGHTYRFYFMVHDGDQNKTGGDTGQGCVTVCFEN